MNPGFGRWLAGLAVLWCTAGAFAQARPLVVELFTSEGCSSCPPAEAYLGQLSARPDIVALAFHVTYWDDLGWRDRFALSESEERQDVYARNLRLASVYTPQLVIDGRSDAVGANGAAIARALNERRDAVPVSVSLRDGAVLAEVGARPGLPPAEVVLVSYLHHAVSAVARGENAGRKLEEFNVVRSIRSLGVWRGAPQSFPVPISSLPADATDVAVLLQPLGQAPFIGAATHALHKG